MKNLFAKIIAGIMCVALIGVLCAAPCSAAVITDGENYYMAGDANGDKTVDLRDLVRAKKISVDNGKAPAVDFNGNETVDSSDFVSLIQMLLKVDLTESWSAIYK